MVASRTTGSFANTTAVGSKKAIAGFSDDGVRFPSIESRFSTRNASSLSLANRALIPESFITIGFPTNCASRSFASLTSTLSSPFRCRYTPTWQKNRL